MIFMLHKKYIGLTIHTRNTQPVARKTWRDSRNSRNAWRDQSNKTLHALEVHLEIVLALVLWGLIYGRRIEVDLTGLDIKQTHPLLVKHKLTYSSLKRAPIVTAVGLSYSPSKASLHLPLSKETFKGLH
jgi:hypothetical protein